MQIQKKVFLILLFLSFCSITFAQNFKIRSINFGYRLYEATPTGNNPYTITNTLKDPQGYQEMLATYPDNGLLGGSAILIPRQYYLNIELSGKSKFWQKYSLQTGFFIGNRLTQRMAVTDWVVLDEGRYIRNDYYFMYKNLRFAGANLGLRRRFQLVKPLNFVVGLEIEARTSVQHYFTQNKQTLVWIKEGNDSNFTETNTKLSTFYGKNYFQTHIMLPFGLEYKYKSIALRAEAFLGFYDDKYRDYLSEKEGHGLSFWVGYNF